VNEKHFECDSKVLGTQQKLVNQKKSNLSSKTNNFPVQQPSYHIIFRLEMGIDLLMSVEYEKVIFFVDI
jgi:hypothetical protein